MAFFLASFIIKLQGCWFLYYLLLLFQPSAHKYGNNNSLKYDMHYSKWVSWGYHYVWLDDTEHPLQIRAPKPPITLWKDCIWHLHSLGLSATVHVPLAASRGRWRHLSTSPPPDSSSSLVRLPCLRKPSAANRRRVTFFCLCYVLAFYNRTWIYRKDLILCASTRMFLWR